MNELLVIGNPAKRKRHKAKRHHVRRNPRRHHARRHHARKRSTFRMRARRNPLPLVGGLMPTLKGGAIGAVGGIANDLAYGFAASKLTFLPAAGITRMLAKLGTALVIGKVGGMALKGQGRNLAEGAVTCVLHDALRTQLSTMATFASVNLGEYIVEPVQIAPGVHGYDAATPVDGIDNGIVDEEGMGEYLDA